MRHKRRTTLATAAAASMTALALLTGCSQGGTDTPGGAGGSGAAEPTGAKLTDEEVAALGDVTLTVATAASGGLREAFDRAGVAFNEKYPNVTVDLSYKAFDDYGRTIDLTMQSNDAPDVAQANAVMARRLVPGNLVLSLDAYWEAYGWDDRFPEAIKRTLTVSQDGKYFGESDGVLWGAAPGGNIVGIFYNKEVLADLGLELPSTFDDFVASMETARDAGVQAIVLGNLEQWPSNHILSPIVGYTAGPGTVQDWVFGAGGSFSDPDFVEGLQIFQDWNDSGFITADANGIKNDDANASFARGDGLYQVTGSWNTATYGTAMGDTVGFAVMPPPDGVGAATTGAFEVPLVISSKSDKADLAALFIDFMTGPESTASNLEGGFLPFSAIDPAEGDTPVAQDVLREWNAMNETDGLVSYLDSATPSMGDAMFPALQSLLGGQATVEQSAETIQKNWDNYYGTK